MERQGVRGAVRGKRLRTTIADASAPRPLDWVNRQFKAQRRNQLCVSDFTYVLTWQGWLYVAFVIDAFARRIVGWRVSSSVQPSSADGTARLKSRGILPTVRYLRAARYIDFLPRMGLLVEMLPRRTKCLSHWIGKV